MVFSVAVWILLDYFLIMPVWVLGFILLATAFVDIDIKNSKFGNRWYLRPLQWVTRHRGVFHSLFLGLLLSLILGGVNLWAGFGFFVGYVSHLFLDCLTYFGVALFWPFSWRIKGFVKSGGVVEDVVFVLLLLVDIFWVVFRIIMDYLSSMLHLISL